MPDRTSLGTNLAYYKKEHIDDPWEIIVAVNPKEYLEKFQSENLNKKHKGLKKGSKVMDFENYVKRINSVREIETFGQLENQKRGQYRISVKINSMIFKETQKSKFAQINGKKYYFSDEVVPLLFSHPFLKQIFEFKKEKKEAKDREISYRGKTRPAKNGKRCPAQKPQALAL